MAGVANTKERRQFRHAFVQANLQKIGELSELWNQEMEKRGYEYKPRKTHPVRAWVESIRDAAGYGSEITWRLIWQVLCSDYEKLREKKKEQRAA